MPKAVQKLIRDLVFAATGTVPMREVLDALRERMLTEALARHDGCVTATARTLGVSHQAVSQVVTTRQKQKQKQRRHRRKP
jgi:hypothetical protein